ncbi:NADP-dependent oxidoreductase [Saccharothrix sp. NRRL B-16348]|uniref:NADP-dependent oxidoreductase n=1 Tax=Saccharothrix sp. NRRL B-16348 TaxID=1415542 RepID=UPI0018D0D1D3|nr:NADP-dependent oxidoreductase [Saccharothrix sp. NRRL B-16348]
MGKTMRAVVGRRYGGPEVLEPAEVPRPGCGPDEVLVRVLAAGVNPVDAECRGGKAEDWFGSGPHTWGWDVSGVVVEVGAGVEDLRPGDEVYGMPRFPALAEGYAEFVSAPAAELAVKPARLRHVDAAALPLSGLTALQTLDRAGVGRGDRLLVNGAAGGVGHLAVQLAKARGATVVAVAREVNHDFLRSLGADEVVDYTTTDVPSAVGEVTAVLDCVGRDELVELVRPGGVHARVPDAATGPTALEEAAARRDVRVVRHVVKPDGAGLVTLAGHVDRGELTVDVGSVLPLREAVTAHKLLDEGISRGKLVLMPLD